MEWYHICKSDILTSYRVLIARVKAHPILTFFFIPILAFLVSGIFRLVLPILVALQFVSYMILFLRQKDKPDVKKNIKEILKL